MKGSVLQKWKKNFKDQREVAKKYFTLLNAFNDFKLKPKEIDLLSHIAVRGTIGSVSSRKEFMDIYNTTMPVINNLISKLYKKKMLVKIQNKIRINPRINIDFTNTENVIINITCLYQNELKTESTKS